MGDEMTGVGPPPPDSPVRQCGTPGDSPRKSTEKVATSSPPRGGRSRGLGGGRSRGLGNLVERPSSCPCDRRVAMICGCCCVIVTAVGILISFFMFPGAWMWFGIFFGLFVWCCAGGFAGMFIAATCGVEGVEVNCCVVLFSFLLPFVSIPLVVTLMVRDNFRFSRDECTEDAAHCCAYCCVGFVVLALWGGSIAAFVMVLIRFCLASVDDPCVGPPPEIPAQMHLRGQAITVNDHPAYDVFSWPGLNETSFGLWQGKVNLLGIDAQGPQLGTFRWKHFARCTAPGQPFGYDETLQLINDKDQPTLFADKKTIYMRTSADTWHQYDVHDCGNNLQYSIHNGLTGMGSRMMTWDIKDPNGDIIAKVDQPFTLMHPPDVYFKAPGIGTVAIMHQHWCGFCFNDDWSVLIEKPDIVHPSVFGYIAVIIKQKQIMEKKQNDNNNREKHEDAI